MHRYALISEYFFHDIKIACEAQLRVCCLRTKFWFYDPKLKHVTYAMTVIQKLLVCVEIIGTHTHLLLFTTETPTYSRH